MRDISVFLRHWSEGNANRRNYGREITFSAQVCAGGAAPSKASGANANIARIQQSINDSLQQDLTATLGGPYITDVRFDLAKITLPPRCAGRDQPGADRVRGGHRGTGPRRASQGGRARERAATEELLAVPRVRRHRQVQGDTPDDHHLRPGCPRRDQRPRQEATT